MKRISRAPARVWIPGISGLGPLDEREPEGLNESASVCCTGLPTSTVTLGAGWSPQQMLLTSESILMHSNEFKDGGMQSYEGGIIVLRLG